MTVEGNEAAVGSGQQEGRRSPGRWRLAGRRADLGRPERAGVLHPLFYEDREFPPYLRRFAVLMVLSAVIAALGLADDSAAVVIGAMLVAPLMTPVLALAAALVMAWPRRQLVSALTGRRSPRRPRCMTD